MNDESTYILPLYHFFQRLRENEFSLGIDDYEKFLTAITINLGIYVKDYKVILDSLYSNNALNEKLNLYPKDYLLRLSKLLWLKPNQSVRVFEDIFEETYLLDFKYLGTATGSLVNAEKKIDNLSDTNTGPQNEKNKERNNKPKDWLTTKHEELKNEDINAKPISMRIGIGKNATNDLSIEKIKKTELEKSKFLFSKDYYPIDNRKMQQNLKALPLFRKEINSVEIDVNATINKVIEKGFFNEVVLTKYKKNVTHFLLLIDHEGSMVAFDQLSKNIHSQIEQVLSPRKKSKMTSLATFYFYNIWEKYLYENKSHTQYQYLDKILKTMKNKQLNIVIISDAGAARGTHNSARINATTDSLHVLKSCTNKLVWLNPMPKERWKNTSAEEIAKSISMFEANENGIRNAARLLKGSTLKPLKLK